MGYTQLVYTVYWWFVTGLTWDEHPHKPRTQNLRTAWFRLDSDSSMRFCGLLLSREFLQCTDTLWLSNIAIDNGFIDDFPIEPSIYKGFSMAMFVITRWFWRTILGSNRTSFLGIWWRLGTSSSLPFLSNHRGSGWQVGEASHMWASKSNDHGIYNGDLVLIYSYTDILWYTH